MKQKNDQIGDTGLLRDRGMIHGCALSELEANLNIPESPTVLQVANFNLEDNILAQYCFVTDKEILTNDKIFPKRAIKRLVIFFHHFDAEDRYLLLPILDSYFQGYLTNNLELPVVLQRWFEQIKKLDPRDRQLLAIWLTRYCFAPSTTLKFFEAATDVVLVEESCHRDSAKLNKTNQRSKLFLLYDWLVRPIERLI